MQIKTLSFNKSLMKIVNLSLKSYSNVLLPQEKYNDFSNDDKIDRWVKDD